MTDQTDATLATKVKPMLCKECGPLEYWEAVEWQCQKCGALASSNPNYHKGQSK